MGWNYYYRLDENKNPVRCKDEAEFREAIKFENRNLAKDKIGKSEVSNLIFLWADHNYFPGGKPILFETMVFGGERDQDQRRYTTYKAAMKGHQEWVEELKLAQ